MRRLSTMRTRCGKRWGWRKRQRRRPAGERGQGHYFVVGGDHGDGGCGVGVDVVVGGGGGGVGVGGGDVIVVGVGVCAPPQILITVRFDSPFGGFGVCRVTFGDGSYLSCTMLPADSRRQPNVFSFHLPQFQQKRL